MVYLERFRLPAGLVQPMRDAFEKLILVYCFMIAAGGDTNTVFPILQGGV